MRSSVRNASCVCVRGTGTHDSGVHSPSEIVLTAACVLQTHTFTFMHLADAFIQSDLHCIQVTVFTFYQLLLSKGIEPMILALLAPCSTIWATGKCIITVSVTRLCSPFGLKLIKLTWKLKLAIMVRGVTFLTRAWGVRPITMHWVSWPIRADCTCWKEGLCRKRSVWERWGK